MIIRHRSLIACLLLFLFRSPVFAQPDSSRVNGPSSACPPALNMDYAKKYYTDTKTICLAPLAWNKINWLTAVLVAGTTVGLYTRDEDIRDWSQRHRNRTSDNMAVFVKPLGDGRYTLPPLALFYAYGYYFNNHKACRTVLVTLESYVISNIFIQTIKLAGHRHRPHTGDPHNTWDGPSLYINNLSFPSGHSNGAFSIAASIAYAYQDKPLIPVVCYSLATLTAFSRVNDNDHWASDIFFGSAVGFFTARAIYKLSLCPSAKNITLEPGPNKLSLVYCF